MVVSEKMSPDRQARRKYKNNKDSTEIVITIKDSEKFRIF